MDPPAYVMVPFMLGISSEGMAAGGASEEGLGIERLGGAPVGASLLYKRNNIDKSVNIKFYENG